MEEIDILSAWARDFGVSDEAVRCLIERLRVVTGPVQDAPALGGSEAWVQSRALLDSGASPDVLLFRNNVGALKDADGRVVRYGLANDSVRINKSIKSGDLIGGRRRVITHADVGQTIMQFVSVECKRTTWRPSGTAHERAQGAWASLINAYGGHAIIYSGHGNILDSI